MGFNDFFKDDFIPAGDGQVPAGSASLPDPVALETEEKTLNVQNVHAVVNIRTLKGRFIAHKFSNGWAVGMVKSVEKKKSVAGLAVKYKSDSLKRIAELKN